MRGCFWYTKAYKTIPGMAVQLYITIVMTTNQPNPSLATVFSEANMSSAEAENTLHQLLTNSEVSQILINGYDRLFYTDANGVKQKPNVFPDEASYIECLYNFIKMFVDTNDVFDVHLRSRTGVIEGSFNPSKTNIHGSLHVVTRDVARRGPVVTIRKQPEIPITLEQMQQATANRKPVPAFNKGMQDFLKAAVKGRSNILISGGSGVGKTTLMRALSCGTGGIDPSHRVITIEEIDELHIANRIPNAVSLMTFRKQNSSGESLLYVSVDDLVREALRMRADRIWIGEVRGKEAYALIKACNSGHEGSCTTIHADSAIQAIRQLITYTMEAGVSEQVAREQVSQAFSVVVQMGRGPFGRRIISEIVEIEPVSEGNVPRQNPLYHYDLETDTFVQTGNPSNKLINQWKNRGGVNYYDLR